MSGKPALPLPEWTRWLKEDFAPLKRLVGVAVEDAAAARATAEEAARDATTARTAAENAVTAHEALAARVKALEDLGPPAEPEEPEPEPEPEPQPEPQPEPVPEPQPEPEPEPEPGARVPWSLTVNPNFITESIGAVATLGQIPLAC